MHYCWKEAEYRAQSETEPTTLHATRNPSFVWFHAHAGAVNVTGFKIDNDAVRNSASVDNDFLVGARDQSR